jgi:hypothetical protein
MGEAIKAASSEGDGSKLEDAGRARAELQIWQTGGSAVFRRRRRQQQQPAAADKKGGVQLQLDRLA